MLFTLKFIDYVMTDMNNRQCRKLRNITTNKLRDVTNHRKRCIDIDSNIIVKKQQIDKDKALSYLKHVKEYVSNEIDTHSKLLKYI